MAYDQKAVDLHAKVYCGLGEARRQATVGQFIFNRAVDEVLKRDPEDAQKRPADLAFIDRLVDKKELGRIVDKVYRNYGNARTAELLDAVKRLGFHFATVSGTTISVTDISIPPQKQQIIDEAEQQITQVEQQHRRGLITAEERYRRICDIWTQAKEDITAAMLNNLKENNPLNSVYMMATSGARGNVSQLSQLAGMRGLMADPSGRIIEIPIKANFREGLTVLEYFTSTHGTRKGLADTALRTADSGYLTRRLVDVSQDVIVREDDCGTTDAIHVGALKEGNEVIEPLRDRIAGRYVAEDITDPTTGEVLIKRNDLVTEAVAGTIEKAGVPEVAIRSVLTCHSRYGVCIHCYGRNLATGRVVEVGEAVGIIAAQSIGEPGTQLTMSTFHTGGVAGEDITQGLPRVEELFEARRPKGQGVISEGPGSVKISEVKGIRRVTVSGPGGEERAYSVPGARLRVRDGMTVEAGDQLTEGPLNPHDILRIRGTRDVQKYLVKEVQEVYRSQGVDINDKHIEVITRQMLRKIKIDVSGDTELLPGSLVDVFEFEEENARVVAQGGKPAEGKTVLLGITKASLATDSFLSAASFQETTRVLTEASIKGKLDPLLGLKENVIIGKLIPAGTGMARYRNLRLVVDGVAPEAAEQCRLEEGAPVVANAEAGEAETEAPETAGPAE
jgi:DNA-directed RNA polymerase subunit beta'